MDQSNKRRRDPDRDKARRVHQRSSDDPLTERPSQGIGRDQRGQEQPTDKARVRQDQTSQASDGRNAQVEAAREQPPSPGEPAGGE